MAKITVLTPVFNGELYIAQALDSLLAQTMADWNLIVVNDGSTDGTSQILAKYQDPRITIIEQPNGGEAAARNTGLENAGGEYVAFLDADDTYMPQALAWMTIYLDSHPDVAVVFSDGYLGDDQGKVLTHLTEHRPGIHEGNILEALVLDAAVVTVPVCTMTRRSAIVQSKARFDPNLVIGPDWDFWIQLAVGHHFGYLDKITCMYRIHQSNISKTAGFEKRRRDLVSGRVKVMNSQWFPALSALTRKKFFYHLLIDLLSGNTNRQVEILESTQLKSLDSVDQQHLWRLVGMDSLEKGANPQDVIDILSQALRRFPGVKKTQWLLHLTQFNPWMAKRLVILWIWAARVLKSFHRKGEIKPKPVPMIIASK